MARTKNTKKKEQKEEPKKAERAKELLEKLEEIVSSEKAQHYFGMIEEFIMARIAHAAETHPATPSNSGAVLSSQPLTISSAPSATPALSENNEWTQLYRL